MFYLFKHNSGTKNDLDGAEMKVEFFGAGPTPTGSTFGDP